MLKWIGKLFGKLENHGGPEPEVPVHAAAVPTSVIIANSMQAYVNSQNSFYGGMIGSYLKPASQYIEKVLIANGRLPKGSN